MEGDRMQQFESFAQMQRDAAMRVMEMQRRAQAAMRNAAPPPALPALTQPDDASPLMEPETAQTGPHQPVCEAHEPMNPPQISQDETERALITAILLLLMREKADEKTRNNVNHAIEVVAKAMQKEQVVDVAKHIIDKASENNNTNEQL